MSEVSKPSKERHRLQTMMKRLSSAEIKVVGKKYFVYNGGIWVPRDRDWLRPHAMRTLDPENQTAQNGRAVLDLCEEMQQSEHDLFKGAVAFDSSGNVLINTLDGVLEVRPDKVIEHPHSPDFHFTRQVQVVYNPRLTCPKYLATMERQLPCEQDRYVKRMMTANFFYPSARFEAALVEIGVTGTGKSTLAEPILRLLGEKLDYRLISFLSIGQLCDNKTYALTELEYSLVNLTTELQTLEVADSANFKIIVSGENLQVREIYEKSRSFKPTTKVWTLANNSPVFRKGSSAELRRYYPLGYNVVVEQRDSFLKPAVGDEKDAVFSTQIIPALQELMTLNAMPSRGTTCTALRARFFVSNDPMGAFIATHVVMDRDGFATRDHITNAMTAFFLEHDMPDTFNKNGYRHIMDRCPNLKMTRPGHLNRERGLEGMRLRQEPLDITTLVL